MTGYLGPRYWERTRFYTEIRWWQVQGPGWWVGRRYLCQRS